MDSHVRQQILLQAQIEDIISLCNTDQSYLQACSSDLFWKEKFEKDGLIFPNKIQLYLDQYFDQKHRWTEAIRWIDYLYCEDLFNPDEGYGIILDIPKNISLFDGLPIDQEVWRKVHQDHFNGTNHRYNPINIYCNNGKFYLAMNSSRFKLDEDQMIVLFSRILLNGLELLDTDMNVIDLPFH